MKKLLLLLFSITNTLIISAQFNLVPNYSFEDINECPAGISGFTWFDDAYVADWFSGTGGTSDYFNSCAGVGSWVNVPDNLFSLDQPAHTGVAYGGFWVNTGSSYYEYAQAQLTSPLIAGECYYVEFWSAPATQSDFFGITHATTDAIGAYFSEDKVGDAGTYDVLPVTPQIENNGTGNYIDPPAEWTKICGYFEAEGGEEWVCIGNYHDFDAIDVVAYTGGTVDANSVVYLFIDDVIVTPVDSMLAMAMPDTVVCSPFELTAPSCADSYLWSNGATTQSITVFETGIYWVDLVTSCGVISDTAEILFVEDSVYTSDDFIEICFNALPYTLEASPSYDYYLWNTGETTSSITIEEGGIYYVTGFADCATFIDSINVQVIDPIGLFPELGNDTLVCEGEWEIILNTPVGFNTYEWSTGETTNSITVTDEGTYSITVESDCEIFTDEITITEDPNLNADIDLGEDLILCPVAGINEVVISVDIILPNYLWNNGETTSSIIVSEAGLYWVTSSLLCSDPSDTLRVTLCDDVAVPNAFSPNGDGINDGLFVIISDPSKIILFQIYNRWGELVYDGNAANFSWDGTFNNILQPIGSYVYYLKYNSDDGEKLIQGNFTLVR
ncbi:MAG: gliding motility-associated C-terminal domain-containing protein [Chitinophagales bacterium]|jgi:gliding motility-associated-like protein|nr:gliding motility-associated C-terminal domain-containing protein [Bacteroidota bacterium]MBK7569455.1 gliding motility-associated C-terminal domain-containing protein [Bacteroidota bacterium]MBP8916334.1 gliding motility-associated C-terminal domain-containing protein [Chitinophagales bacterium]MBP9220065.1 gliding motility-associated C-terminal domain-containing protein [Chitinophagales bacterium]MBP9794700.1 gliding motility-associated C-terminal domain-containing protein [Chitinophagales 